jgi:hypothetical protein
VAWARRANWHIGVEGGEERDMGVVGRKVCGGVSAGVKGGGGGGGMGIGRIPLGPRLIRLLVRGRLVWGGGLRGCGVGNRCSRS